MLLHFLLGSGKKPLFLCDLVSDAGEHVALCFQRGGLRGGLSGLFPCRNILIKGLRAALDLTRLHVDLSGKLGDCAHQLCRNGFPLLLLLHCQSGLVAEVRKHGRRRARRAGGLLNARCRVCHRCINARKGVFRRFGEQRVKQGICGVCACRKEWKHLLAHRRHGAACVVLQCARGVGKLVFRARKVALNGLCCVHQVVIARLVALCVRHIL